MSDGNAVVETVFDFTANVLYRDGSQLSSLKYLYIFPVPSFNFSLNHLPKHSCNGAKKAHFTISLNKVILIERGS